MSTQHEVCIICPCKVHNFTWASTGKPIFPIWITFLYWYITLIVHFACNIEKHGMACVWDYQTVWQNFLQFFFLSWVQLVLKNLENPPLMKPASWTRAAPFKEEKYHRTPSESIANNFTPTANNLKIRALRKRKSPCILWSYHQFPFLCNCHILTSNSTSSCDITIP